MVEGALQEFEWHDYDQCGLVVVIVLFLCCEVEGEEVFATD